MSEFLIVRINENLIPDFQINYNTNNKIANKKNISSWQEVEYETNQKLILIITANLVYNTHVTIPSKNEEIIRQSIPFAIEEQLTNEIGDNHYAYIHIKEQNFLVSVIKKDIIQTINEHLQDNGLEGDGLYSELFSIPIFPDKMSLLLMDDYILVNESLYTGTRIRNDELKSYLQLTKSQEKIVFTEKKPTQENNSKDRVKVINTAVLQAETIISGHYVNLFQGNYKASHDDEKQSNPWKKVLLFTIVLVSSWMFINLYQLWRLNTNIEQLKNQQRAFLQKIIPNASQTEKNDPYAAIQSFLRVKQNQDNSTTASGFIQHLSYLGKNLMSYPNMQVQSLRQRDHKLEIKLLASDVTELNHFQSSLEKLALSMRVKMGTRETTKDGITSVITMEQL